MRQIKKENKKLKKKEIAGVKNGVTQKQLAAMRVIRRLGKEIVQEYGEKIVKEYREGTCARIISEKYLLNISLQSKDVALRVVYNVLERMLGEEEVRVLGKEHIIKNNRKNGVMNYQSGVGIAAMTTEKRAEICRRAAITRCINQGVVLWSKEECADLLGLLDQEEYIHQSGRGRGKANLMKISDYLNNKYHNGKEVRTPRLSSVKLYKLRHPIS